MRVFRSLMPREERFLEDFIAHSALIVAAADKLMEFMTISGEEERRACSLELSKLEKEADKIERKTIVALHRAFITPFDRSDIRTLVQTMDDIVDLIEDVTHHSALYGVMDFSPRMIELAKVIQSQAKRVQEVIPLLSNVSGNASRIRVLCDIISTLESDGDRLLYDALKELIKEAPPVTEFLGRKDIYEILEAVTDRCDDVGDVIEGIVLDHV